MELERPRPERHFCSLLRYFFLSWLQIFQLCLSFWTSSFDLVFFKFLQEKENVRKTTQNASALSIFIVFLFVLKLGTPLLDFTRVSRTQTHHLSYCGFFFICIVTLYLSFVFVLLPASCFLVTLDTLRLIHKTPTSTPNVTFPQRRRDNAPHLPDSSMVQTSKTDHFLSWRHFVLHWRISLFLVWLESSWLQLPGDVLRLLIVCRVCE